MIGDGLKADQALLVYWQDGRVRVGTIHGCRLPTGAQFSNSAADIHLELLDERNEQMRRTAKALARVAGQTPDRRPA